MSRVSDGDTIVGVSILVSATRSPAITTALVAAGPVKLAGLLISRRALIKLVLSGWSMCLCWRDTLICLAMDISTALLRASESSKEGLVTWV